MKTIRLQQGDSFKMNFVMRENGVPTDIHPGEVIAIGFYSECCPKYIAKSSEGQIIKGSEVGLYILQMQSDITKNFIGDIDVEIVVYDSSGNTVSHADKVLKMFFEERRINEEI